MSAPYDIVGYTYDADIYCPSCAVELVLKTLSDEEHDAVVSSLAGSPSYEHDLTMIAAVRGIDREDEGTFDSGDFPKVVLRQMLDDTERCGECGCEL